MVQLVRVVSWLFCSGWSGGLGGPGGPSGPGGPAGQNGQVVRWFPPGWSNLNINISNMKIKYWIS